MTITGTDFTGASSVSFGGVTASQFTVNSATSITATTPAGAGAGATDVTVTNGGGSSAAGKKATFGYTPVIEAVTPNTGAAAGGTSVTVTGQGFSTVAKATKFTFGKTKVKTVSCTKATSCTVTAPTHAAGAVDVIATVAKGKSLASPGDQFTYG